jgi:L-ascorbate metabolism protein UlaG (beta-lactamase superfamily)
MEIKYYGHSTFGLTNAAGETLLIDPYLDANPQAPVKSDQVRAEYIALSHAHGDHCADTYKIAKRCGSLIIAVSELASLISAKGYKTYAMQIGGGHSFPFGRIKFTQALHGSQTPDGQYAGLAAGILIWMDGVCVYHTGDTGLFYDMKLIGDMNKVDYMLLPIGDNYTMGPDDALKAVELVSPRVAIPMHYNTWPLIAADPEVFASKVRSQGRECLILKPGGEISVSS